MMREWLTKRVTVTEAEAAHMHEGVPFGYCNREWVAFKEKILPGDQLWEFRSPNESWAIMGGRAGIALVRGGEVIASLVTRMN